MVMLSATIDNPIGFAEWIENRDSEKMKEVYLASTEYRVVPLTHYGFFATSETPFKMSKDKALHEKIRAATNKPILLRTANGQFKDGGYTTLQSIYSLFDKYDWRMKRQFVLNKLAGYLKENEMLPAITFVFSRKSVETCAHEITTNLLEDDSKVPYTIRRECEQIVRRFPNHREYLELPEYESLVKLLEKGIGIHHSGMMPVLREIVELMISKKYIKMLFATESFAIGLDCPIKTAVFSALKKFDGTHTRFLLPHEYTQMAGRAGRRGIDTVGHVIHCNNLFDMPIVSEYKEILCGKPQKLVSKFKLSYPLLLNLIKTKECSTEFVKKSMLQIELDTAIRVSHTEYDQHISLYDKQKETFSTLPTPEELCKEYIKDDEHMSMYSSKKQKELQKKFGGWKSQYPTFQEDVAFIKSHIQTRKTMENVKNELDYLENYTAVHMKSLCELLTENDFLEENVFTKKGEIAAHLHEIHPLIGADLFQYTSFMTYSARQMIAFLSIFTDISIPEDCRAIHPQIKDSIVIKDIYIVGERSELYARQELERGLYSPEVNFTYDLVDVMDEWCSCDSEQSCKYFLQKTIGEREISLGDFTKTVLKIVVIVKEWKVVAEMIGDLRFLSTLNEIEPLVLKYVATNQSLYV
jgi:superfamily II RNA helicase